jgi:hypothetical protein
VPAMRGRLRLIALFEQAQVIRRIIADHIDTSAPRAPLDSIDVSFCGSFIAGGFLARIRRPLAVGFG